MNSLEAQRKKIQQKKFDELGGTQARRESKRLSAGQMHNIDVASTSKSCLLKPGGKRKVKKCRFGAEPKVVINKIPYGNDDRYLFSDEEDETKVKGDEYEVIDLKPQDEIERRIGEQQKKLKQKVRGEFVQGGLDSLSSNMRELLAQARVNRLHVHTGSEEEDSPSSFEDENEENEEEEDEDEFDDAEEFQDLEDEEFQEATVYFEPAYPHIYDLKVTPSMTQEKCKEPETITYSRMGSLKSNNNQGANRFARYRRNQG